jgi:hypothetical protein
MSNPKQVVSRRSALQYAAEFESGIAFGSILIGGAPTDRIASAALQTTPDPTATREAEGSLDSRIESGSKAEFGDLGYFSRT